MVTRINDLLYQIYHTELEKKDAEFYAPQAQIEPHFLYNILENAIKHARTAVSPLTIELNVRDRFETMPCGDVILEITDNGEGILPRELTSLNESLKNTNYIRDAHIGLNSINNRLQAFFGKDYALQIKSSQNKGTTVTIYLK